MSDNERLWHRVTEYVSKGREHEELFATFLESIKGGNAVLSDRDTDMSRHIDVVWYYGGKSYTFDVKSATTTTCSDGYAWVELKNVSGNNGWILGDAEYIAFDFIDRWVIIPRSRLLDITMRSVNTYNVTQFIPDSCGVLYQRRNRNDVILKVPCSEIITNSRVISKDTKRSAETFSLFSPNVRTF